MKKKKITLLAAVLATAAMFTGCTIENEYVPVDTEVQVMETNDIGVPSLSQTLDIPDEDFKLVCEYGTNGYDLNNWRVTDPKQVSMKVHTQGLPDGYDVVIDHVHADISLLSISPQINGITQDSMDDTFHGQTQDGFAISNDTDYYNVFAIEGYTSQFYELWGCAFGQYGSLSSSYERLTENNIIQVGTYGEKISIVYDISIKKPGSDKYYTKSVMSTLGVPVSQKLNKKDAVTGEPVE